MSNGNVTQPIYRWNGKYFGFMSNGYLLDSAGTYRGWIDGNGTVWQANGKFLGDLVGGEYVLLQQSIKRASQPKRLSPTPVALPPRPEDKPARSPRRLRRWSGRLRIIQRVDSAKYSPAILAGLTSARFRGLPLAEQPTQDGSAISFITPILNLY